GKSTVGGKTARSSDAVSCCRVSQVDAATAASTGSRLRSIDLHIATGPGATASIDALNTGGIHRTACGSGKYQYIAVVAGASSPGRNIHATAECDLPTGGAVCKGNHREVTTV